MHQRIEGFTDYRVDAVLKFGGSLTRDLPTTQALIDAIIDCRMSGLRLLIVPGGGRTDKTIEALDREQPLAPDTFHIACALAQDQTGLILSDPGFSSVLVPCRTISECVGALNANKVPVLLPSTLIIDADPIEKTWDVTSDAVAAWVAWLVRAPKIAILTDVDGIYAEGHIGDAEHLISDIGYRQLLGMGHTSIDRCAAAFVSAYGLETAVLNGVHPDRLKQWLKGRPTTGTRISSRETAPVMMEEQA